MDPLFTKNELMIAKAWPQLKLVTISGLKLFHTIKSVNNNINKPLLTQRKNAILAMLACKHKLNVVARKADREHFLCKAFQVKKFEQ